MEFQPGLGACVNTALQAELTTVASYHAIQLYEGVVPSSSFTHISLTASYQIAAAIAN